MQESMSLKYEPASKPLHISVKWWGRTLPDVFEVGDRPDVEIGAPNLHIAGSRASGFGFRVLGFELWASGFGFQVSDPQSTLYGNPSSASARRNGASLRPSRLKRIFLRVLVYLVIYDSG